MFISVCIQSDLNSKNNLLGTIKGKTLNANTLSTICDNCVILAYRYIELVNN